MARIFISRFRRVVILFLCLSGGALFSSEIYILSYKSQVKDSQITYQSLFASLAMTPTDKKNIKTETIFLTKKCSKAKFFSCYESEILEFLLQSTVYIKSEDRSDKLIETNFSELNISPQYVQVEFNDTFVKISLLK